MLSKDDTESTCEVVKIHAIIKHPNADKLEIAHFSFANGLVPDYQVVVGKGEFVVGEWAVYISDDMLVPVDKPQFAFLKDKAKGGYHRVRACRLRGQMSTGLLVPMKDQILGKLGDDVAAKLGVLKYESPLDGAGANSVSIQRKKLGLFSRIVYSVIRRFYTPVKVPDYSVLSLRKVPNLFEEGEPVIITEKIHGSNIRFGRVNGRVYIGSHRTEKSDSRPWFIRCFSGRKAGAGYYGHDVWSKWFNRIFDSKEKLDRLPNNIVFYGELFGHGIQPWTYGLSNTQVVVFDAYHVKDKRWLPWSEIQSNLPPCINMVPSIQWGVPFNRAECKALAEGKSIVPNLGFPLNNPTVTNREGVVIRSCDWKRAGKLVSDNYLASEH